MSGDKGVNVRQRGSHPTDERLVGGDGFARIDPNDVVGESGESSHVRRKNFRILNLPTVRNNYHYRTTGNSTSAEIINKGLY